MEYQDYLDKLTSEIEDQNNVHLRVGQMAFNELYRVRPDLTNKIRGRHQDLDPFYFDENLTRFHTYIKENW